MKFIKADKSKLLFNVNRDEMWRLFKVLDLYPLIPASHSQLSRSGKRPEDQRLLEEAMAATRLEHRNKILDWKKSRADLFEAGSKGTLSVKSSELEWLLQVLNDVRVGSWLALGSPDGPAEYLAAINEATARHFWAMETAGHFQMILLSATDGGT